MRIGIMVASILLIMVVDLTNINTDLVLMGLIVALTVCIVYTKGMPKHLLIVFNVAVFLALISSAVMSNYLEGKPLVMYSITAILVCIHIRFFKTKSTNDTVGTNES